jgi:hypothetical protein
MTDTVTTSAAEEQKVSSCCDVVQACKLRGPRWLIMFIAMTCSAYAMTVYAA